MSQMPLGIESNTEPFEIKRRISIMVVDDDQERLGMLQRTLEFEGYRVLPASDGSSAVVLLERCKPNLIILDIMMPGLGGFQVLNLIRERSQIPVIMISAQYEETYLQLALAAGANDYMRKPFSTAELVVRIRAKLRRTGLGTQLTKSPILERILCNQRTPVGSTAPPR